MPAYLAELAELGQHVEYGQLNDRVWYSPGPERAACPPEAPYVRRRAFLVLPIAPATLSFALAIFS